MSERVDWWNCTRRRVAKHFRLEAGFSLATPGLPGGELRVLLFESPKNWPFETQAEADARQERDMTKMRTAGMRWGVARERLMLRRVFGRYVKGGRLRFLSRQS